MTKPAASLLLDHLGLLKDLNSSLPVLDLACGTGRNGLALAELGITVVFADRSLSLLNDIEQRLLEGGLPGHIWPVDLERPGIDPFLDQRFGAVIGFCYLHRPLFPGLLDAVKAGGLVIYETFTTEQRRFGRPRNPDFLLRPGELKAIFQAWEIIHHFEGLLESPERSVAQIVARKPGS